MNTIESNRARFLTVSRAALGLPERRCAPDRGEGARKLVKRRANGGNFQPERWARADRPVIEPSLRAHPEAS